MIIAVVAPVAALALSAVCTLVGVALFVIQPPSRDWRPAGRRTRTGCSARSARRGVRTLMFATIPVGFCFGAVEISLPAFADRARRAGVGGRAAAGVGGGERGRRPHVRRAHVSGARSPRCTSGSPALLPLGFLPALAPSRSR